MAKKTKKDLVQNVEVQEPIRVVVPHHAVTDETIASDAATHLITAPFVPLTWTATMKEWSIIRQGVQDIILQAIKDARTQVPNEFSSVSDTGQTPA